MKKLSAILFAVLFATQAIAQTFPGQLPAWNLWANPSGSQAIPKSATVPQMLDGSLCSTPQSIPYRTTTWVCAQTVLNATTFAGADLGVQIAACINAVPAQGGTCDARGLPNTGTISGFTVSKSGVTILWPCGFYLVTGPIIFQNNAGGISGIVARGCGASFNAVGTSFFWQGGSTGPLLDLRAVRDSFFEHFTIGADSSHPLAEGIRRETWTGGVSTRVTFNDILITGNIANSIFKGIRWCTGFTPSGGDCSNGVSIGNNDLDIIQSVSVANYTNCAFSIEGTQSKTHMFINSSLQGQSFSQRGVCTTQSGDASTNAGSFRWYGGAGGSNQIADFDLGQPTDDIMINGCNFEGSKRLLQTTGVSAATWAVNIEGCRWTSNNINADGKVVIYQQRGALNLLGNHIELAGSAVVPTFSIESSGAPQIGNAIGNSIETPSAAAGYTPFICGSGSCWSQVGNVTTVAGVNFQVPNVLQPNPLTVAQLPACNAGQKGNQQFVTDQNTGVAYRGSVTGGGSTNQAVVCDGTNWLQD